MYFKFSQNFWEEFKNTVLHLMVRHQDLMIKWRNFDTKWAKYQWFWRRVSNTNISFALIKMILQCAIHCAWGRSSNKRNELNFHLFSYQMPSEIYFWSILFWICLRADDQRSFFVDHLSNNWQVVIFRSLPLREVGDLGIFPSRLVIFLYSEYYWLVNSYRQV